MSQIRFWISLLETPSQVYHVTEREDAKDIVQNGFEGGWGDVGFGVYFYGTPTSAERYAAKGGWDNRLKDPVILVVSDPEIEQVTDLDPSWNASEYQDMYWHPMDDEFEEERWVPAHIAVVDAPKPRRRKSTKRST